jgi:hypothetical protein
MHTTFPNTLEPHCSSLLKEIVSRSPDLDVWAAVAELLKAHDPTISDAPSVAAVDENPSVAPYVKRDWSNRFLGNSLHTLRTVIRNFEGQEKKEKDGFYSRTLIFLQSSGVGKSRLADTFGRSCPMINYVLRESRAIGFPPADDEILLFMRMQPQSDQKEKLTESPEKNHIKPYPPTRADTIWYHSLAVGVLQASFEELYKWVEKSSLQSTTHLAALAALRHKEMAYNPEDLTSQPEKRIEFCQNVAKRAKDIALELAGKGTWRRAFDSNKGSAIRHKLNVKKENHLGGLWAAAKKLTKFLALLPSENANDPLLVVVFDEASSLLKEPGGENINPGRYVALSRIMSCLREYRIWFFIISTESQVGVILPPDDAHRSGDYVKDDSLRAAAPQSETRLKRIPPFLAFPLNIEDVEAMRYPRELDKTLSDFGTQRHMAMFGRRLWYAYIDDPEEMDELAQQKLIGGLRSGIYEARNVDHVFAALSFRLSLDACLYNSKAIHLINNAVNSHMRVVLAMDHSAGIMHTVSPSEPILAKAAMDHLCKGTNWSTSINTLVTELIEKGIVEKGLKGELYVRLILTLARDCIRGSPKQDDPHSLTTFTVGAFLTTLYAEKHKFIAKIDQRILQAKMNFTHFIPTHGNLNPATLSDLFVDLLRRSAALQLGPVQATYDMLIPIYFGDENEPLDPKECGCIVVQVKNREKATTPRTLFAEDFTTVEDSDAALTNTRRRRTSKKPLPNAEPEETPENASTNAKRRKTSKKALPNAEPEETPENASTNTETSKNTLPNAEPEETPENASTNTKEKDGPVRNGDYFFFKEMEKPILCLLFDLGVVRTALSTSPAFEVSYTKEEKNPRVWVIHSRGHGSTLFGCLGPMDCAKASDSFFRASVIGSSEHDQAAKRNDCFYDLDRSFRYPEGIGNGKTQSGV